MRAAATILAMALCSGQPAWAGEPAGVRGMTAPIVLDHNRALVDAEVQSKDGSWRKARLWIDSGNPEFMLSESFARALGFDRPGQAAGAPRTPASLPVVGVRINGVPLDVEGLAPVVRPGAERLWPTMHADGNLPATVLRRYAVVLDYPGRRIELRPPGQAAHRGQAVPLRVHPETGIVQVDAVIGNAHLALALDIGASYSFVTTELAATLASGHPGWPRTEGAMGCANIWGLWPQEDHWQVVRAPEIRLGDTRISGVGFVGLPPVFGSDPDIGTWYSRKTAAPVVGFLGPNAFKAFRLEIDYVRGRLYLERRAADDVRDMDMIGLTLQPDGTSWRVLRTLVAGVQAGDLLLQVGGLRTSGATMGAVVDALRGRPGDQRVLLLERRGQRLRIVARVRRILP